MKKFVLTLLTLVLLTGTSFALQSQIFVGDPNLIYCQLVPKVCPIKTTVVQKTTVTQKVVVRNIVVPRVVINPLQQQWTYQYPYQFPVFQGRYDTRYRLNPCYNNGGLIRDILMIPANIFSVLVCPDSYTYSNCSYQF